jgi:hypothetical protein
MALPDITQINYSTAIFFQAGKEGLVREPVAIILEK